MATAWGVVTLYLMLAVEGSSLLRKHLPKTPTLEVFSTGAAAQMAANNPNVGAIASSLAINTYGLQMVVRGIEDYQGNTTRFLVIGRKSPKKSGCDKTSILIGLIQTFAVVIDVSAVSVMEQLGSPISFEHWAYPILKISVSQMAPILPYLLLVLILIFRPKGLLGTREE